MKNWFVHKKKLRTHTLITSSPHTHLSPRKIAEQTGISRSSIRRMIEGRNFFLLKRVKTPKIRSRHNISWKVLTQYSRDWKKQYGMMKKILPLMFLLKWPGIWIREKIRFSRWELVCVRERDVKKSYGFRCDLLVRCHETVFCEWKWY